MADNDPNRVLSGGTECAWNSGSGHGGRDRPPRASHSTTSHRTCPPGASRCPPAVVFAAALVEERVPPPVLRPLVSREGGDAPETGLLQDPGRRHVPRVADGHDAPEVEL